jgi:hypothetical protein
MSSLNHVEVAKPGVHNHLRLSLLLHHQGGTAAGEVFPEVERLGYNHLQLAIHLSSASSGIAR